MGLRNDDIYSYLDIKKRNDDIFSNMDDNIRNYTAEKKIKKFFRFAVPILVIEIIAFICLGIYLIFLPKNYCKISTNIKECVVYVNDKQTKKFRMDNPKTQSDYYFYSVDIGILLPGEDTYSVNFTLKCSKYNVSASTFATETNNIYNLTVSGGVKTQILSAITIHSTELIKDFDLKIEIFAEKI